MSAFLLFALALMPQTSARCAEGTPAPRRRLMLFGGGALPGDALENFVRWSGGARSRILVVSWASEYPAETSAEVREGLLARGAASVELAVSTSAGPGWADAFRAQLSSATGVFLGGGDQVRFMSAVDGGALLDDIRRAYAAGKPFAGTSAGTAVMSGIMITGEGDLRVIDGSAVGVRDGLGLLPGVITDQHFIVRQRENRLFGLVLRHPSLLGVGVDEPAAFAVEDDRTGVVFGTGGAIMIVEARAGREGLVIELLRPGQRYDLKARRRL